MEQLLYRSVDALTIGSTAFILRVKTDGTNLTVDFEQNPRSVTSESLFDVDVYYGNTVKTVSIGSRNSGSTVFPYDSEISAITLSGAGVVSGGTDFGSIASFAWGTGYGRPLPEADFLPDGPERVSNSAVRCTVTCPAGKYPALLGVWAYRYNEKHGWQLQQTLNLSSQYGGDAWHHIAHPYVTGDLIRYTCVYAYYSNAESALRRGSDYEALAEMHSPAYTVSDNGGYYVPYDLSWSVPTKGCPVQISWGTFLDMKGIFELERCADGGEWVLIYAGASNRFTDTAGEWDTVSYRVRSYKGSGSFYSQWLTGDVTQVGRTNLYIGVGGVPTPASGIYVGQGGSILPCIPMIHAGA